MLVDALVLVAAFSLAYVARVQYDPRPLLHNIYAYDFLFAFLLIVPVWVAVFAFLGLYHHNTYNRRLAEWGKIAIGSFIGILLIIGFEYISDKDLFPARLVAAYALVGSFFLIVIEREIMRFVRDVNFRFGKGVKRLLLIGSSGATNDIAFNLSDTKRSGYTVVAIAGPKRILPDSSTAIHFASPEQALKQIKELGISAIIQTDLYENAERNQQILSAAQTHHIDYSFIPGESEFYSGKNTVDVFLGYPMIGVYQTPLVGWGAIVKRVFDLVASFFGIIILSPFILIFFIILFLDRIFEIGLAQDLKPNLGE